MPYPKQDLFERFHKKYIPVPETGCWLWIGPGNRHGNLKIWNDGNPYYVSAHKLSFQLHVGEIPKGMLVLHTCDVEGCVNPKHLYLGTNSQNQKDRFSRTKRFKRDTQTGRFLPNL